MTVIGTLPALATWAALTDARSSLTEICVVARGEPFQATAELVPKPLPNTVSIKAALPDGTDAGESLVRASGGRLWMRRLTVLDGVLPAAESLTVIAALP